MEKALEITVSVRNEHILRGVAKMAFEAFVLVHRDHAYDLKLDKIRNFIMRAETSE